MTAGPGALRTCGYDVLIAVPVGIAGASIALATRELLLGVAALVTGAASLGGPIPRLTPAYGTLGVTTRLTLPVLGALLGGLLITFVAPETHGQGVPAVRTALKQVDGAIRRRVIAVKPFATVLCVGTGGSAGLFGPLVHTGAAVGSAAARALRLPPGRARVLVPAGGAGAIAGLFGAPLGSASFAIEVLAVGASVRAVTVVGSAALAGVAVRWVLVGTAPLFDVHPSAIPARAYLLLPVLGVMCAVIGTAFVRTMALIERAADRLVRCPAWLLPAAGAILLGPLLLVRPELWGVGLPAAQAALTGHYTMPVLGALVIGKLLANSLTVGSGGSGGSFTPLLFAGAMFGSAFGEVAVSMDLTDHPRTFGLLAMAGVAAGATRAPVAASLIVLETTHSLSVALPIVATVAVSTFTSRVLISRFLYDMDSPDLSRKRLRIKNPPP